MRSTRQTPAANGFECYRKRTRRGHFLTGVAAVVQREPPVKPIPPVCPKGEGAGRPPAAPERILRIRCLQHRSSLSDAAVAEALFYSRVMRGFVASDPSREPARDETAIRKFRQLREARTLGSAILVAASAHLTKQGFKVAKGTIVDATIIRAPRSITNRGGRRDPTMPQTKQGYERNFGIKAHLGVDRRPRLIRSVAAAFPKMQECAAPVEPCEPGKPLMPPLACESWRCHLRN